MNYTLEALAGLSLQHASKYMVQAPTNEDRLRAFRACVRPEIGNSHVWPWTRTGAAQACPKTTRKPR